MAKQKLHDRISKNGGNLDPLQLWTAMACADEQDVSVVEVECPVCGEVNEESDWEEYHYTCTECGTSYDMTVCDSCEATIGYHFGDDGICPKCGEQYTKEENL